MNGALKEKLKQYLLRKHPDWLAAYDYYAKRQLKASWGGPFNGQAGRQQIFRDLLNKGKFQAIIETGTYRGTTTQFLAEESNLPIYTVEAEPRYFHFSRFRLRRHRTVHLQMGDSRAFLEKLASDKIVPKSDVFFYLDSHWGEDLPLNEEVRSIAKSWRGVAIMIDDFQVPGDGDYLYDDYGPGKRLCLEDIGPLAPLGLVPFFPTLPSEKETGRKRGCTVLADQSMTERVATIPSLRRG